VDHCPPSAGLDLVTGEVAIVAYARYLTLKNRPNCPVSQIRLVVFELITSIHLPLFWGLLVEFIGRRTTLRAIICIVAGNYSHLTVWLVSTLCSGSRLGAS